jgi:hypothetical protein
MPHLGRESLRRILGGEGGPQEVETAAEHLVSCDSCRALAGELRAETPELPGEGPLPLVFALIDQERRWAVDYLAAVAEWAELRRLRSWPPPDAAPSARRC